MTLPSIFEFAANPEIAYLIFMASLALLYAEITHPGLIAPGVIGGIGLVISLVSFHQLDVVWGGLALILLGVGFLIAEVYVTSFGVLGIGGVVAFYFGSSLLFSAESGHQLPWILIFGVTVVLASILLGLGYLAMRTLKRGRHDTDYDLKTKSVRIISLLADRKSGQVEILGEIWKFTSEKELSITDPVEVLGRKGLTLNIRKKE